MNKKKVELRLTAHQEYLASVKLKPDNDRPNIVLIFVDDMGHGDISCYGSTAIHTPNLDRLAENGVKMHNFYASSPVCSPSRFSCMTGRYPTRGFVHNVFFPKRHPIGKLFSPFLFPYGVRGILPDEITVAEALQASGYRTGIFGKWHLGDKSPYLPNEKGFDYFYGSYYSNDMTPYAYYRNDEVVIDAPADQTKLTQLITHEILNFIDANKEGPFFVYYPSPFPHFPVHSSEEFSGTSQGGSYGDCVEEIDWSVGEIMKKLDEHGLSENTLVIFTSDNGPWFEGSPGFHRGRKGNTFDGGQIVPMIASWPCEIPKGQDIELAAMNIDFFPTFLNIAGIPLPQDREIDGVDILPLLQGKISQSPHKALYFIYTNKPTGIRSDSNFKYFERHKSENAKYWISPQGPFLFNLNHDTNESYDVQNIYPELAEVLAKQLADKQEAMKNNPRGWKK
jgi:arylsulfatase A-like enzyme